MINKQLPASLLLFAALLLTALASCATGMGQAPLGGPADSTAPRILSSSPASGTTNFTGQTVTVVFDEYIQESTVPSATIITPAPVTPPDYDWSGRELEIEFAEPLLANRTYTVTLGSAITDLSNNRLGTPLTIRFSTGPTIDSGVVRGTIVDIGKRRPSVFAYRIPEGDTTFGDTLRPDLTPPDFVVPVGDDGRFSFEALPPGRFRLFVVADEYGDRLYTPGTDAFGVAVSDVTIDSSYTPVGGVSIRLGAGPIDATPPEVFAASSISSTRTEVRFSEPVDTVGLSPSNFSLGTSTTTASISAAWRSPASRLAVQLVHSPLPSGEEATVRATALRDTIGNVLPDSVATATFVVSPTIDTIAPRLLSLSVDSTRGYAFPDTIRVAFDEGVRIDNPRALLSIADSGSARRARFNVVQRSAAELIAVPIDSLVGATRGFVELDLRGVSDLVGNREDTVIRRSVPIQPARQSGTLQGTISDSTAPRSRHVIVATLVGTGRVFRKSGVLPGPWEFESIPEGEYEIYAFRDADGDGLYDFGSISPYRPSEAIVYWPTRVRVRPRWVTNEVDLVF